MSVIGAGRKCNCCNGCPYCTCMRDDGNTSYGRYCYYPGLRGCTADNYPGPGRCCEVLCDKRTGPLTVRDQNVEWIIPHACRWGHIYMPTNDGCVIVMEVIGTHNAGEMYYFARVTLEISTTIAPVFPYEEYCEAVRIEDVWFPVANSMSYTCELEQRLGGQEVDEGGYCRLLGGSTIYQNGEQVRVDEHDLPKELYIPDITVFNESKNMAPYFPPMGVAWEFYPGFIINTLKLGFKC